jgi:hypothetical protein
VRTFKADDDDDDNDYDSDNCLLHNVFITPPANYNPTLDSEISEKQNKCQFYIEIQHFLTQHSGICKQAL